MMKWSITKNLPINQFNFKFCTKCKFVNYWIIYYILLRRLSKIYVLIFKNHFFITNNYIFKYKLFSFNSLTMPWINFCLKSMILRWWWKNYQILLVSNFYTQKEITFFASKKYTNALLKLFKWKWNANMRTFF